MVTHSIEFSLQLNIVNNTVRNISALIYRSQYRHSALVIFTIPATPLNTKKIFCLSFSNDFPQTNDGYDSQVVGSLNGKMYDKIRVKPELKFWVIVFGDMCTHNKL